MKHISKQYGKNMKKFEDATLNGGNPSEEIREFDKKHNITQRKPMISIINNRWGFPSRSDNNLIKSVEDIENVAKS